MVRGRLVRDGLVRVGLVRDGPVGDRLVRDGPVGDRLESDGDYRCFLWRNESWQLTTFACGRVVRFDVGVALRGVKKLIV